MSETTARLRQLGALAPIGALAIGASLSINALAPQWTWHYLPFHAVLEGFGAFAALTIALLVLLLRRYGHLRPVHLWLASGLIGMGVLDGFHAATHAGGSFVWLHSVATLVGGVLFACIWLPEVLVTYRAIRILPAVMLVCSLASGILSIAVPQILPAMKAEQGFTTVAKALNVVGGAGFLAAMLYFLVLRYSGGSGDALIWASQCLLFGVAGVLFAQSALWDGAWWLWHVFRALAYGVILYYFFALYHRGQVELQQSRDLLQQRVEERTKELVQANEGLKNEVYERGLAEERLRVTLSSIGDGVIATDTNRDVIRLNRAAEALIGWRESEALGQPLVEVFRIINEHTRAPAEDPVGRVLATGRIEGLANHTVLIARDGTERAIADSAAPIQAQSGKTIGVVLVFRDVSEERRQQNEKDRLLHDLGERVKEREQAEEALLRSRSELAIRNRIAQSFLTISDDDMYAEVLEVVLEAVDSEHGVFGYIDESGALVVPTMSRQVWGKCQVADRRVVFPRDTWTDGTWPRAIREERTIYSNEPTTSTPAGHIAITRHVSLPIIHQGTVVGLIQVANKETDYSVDDIQLLETIGGTIAPVLSARLQRERQESARADAEQQLAVKVQELARSNAELEQFAYIASHDLKAPLRAIDNLSKWIEEDLKDLLAGETRENMELMRGRVLRLEALLDDLLEYSRAGRIGTEVEVIDTAATVEEIVALLDPPEGFAVRVHGDLPRFWTAKVPLEQALRNLVGNAIKHHDRTTGRVDVSVEDRDDFYEFTVADDGPGIPSELREKAFQMFQTLRPRDEVEGSGMGLAVVRKLVEWQGGTIRLESGPDGRGAVFRFTWKKDWQSKEAEPCLTTTP